MGATIMPERKAKKITPTPFLLKSYLSWDCCEMALLAFSDNVLRAPIDAVS